MEHGTDARTARKQIYDVVLSGGSSDSLQSRFPTMTIRGIQTQTALRRRVGGPTQLEDLLEKLWSLGLPLLEVHRLPGGTRDQQTYEVRVGGVVGESLLRHLSCSHRVVSGQVRVRIAAATSEIQQFLLACTEIGAEIHRVRLVVPARQPQVA